MNLIHTNNSCFLTPGGYGFCHHLIAFCRHRPMGSGGTIWVKKQIVSREMRCQFCVRGALYTLGFDPRFSEPL